MRTEPMSPVELAGVFELRTERNPATSWAEKQLDVASHPSPDPALLLPDVLGDVCESPQALSERDRPAGEKRGQWATD